MLESRIDSKRFDKLFRRQAYKSGVIPSETVTSGTSTIISTKEKLSTYLYYFDFQDYDYFESLNHFNKFYTGGGSCSCGRYSNFVVRSFDWTLDDLCNSVVHVHESPTRLASIGCTGSVFGFDKSYDVDKDQDNLLRFLPARTTDGVNSAGVYVATLVNTPYDFGQTTGTRPGDTTIPAPCVCRYILDHALSALHAVQLFQEVNIFSPYSENLIDEFHWLVADASNTFLVELLHNRICVTPKSTITNFPRYTEFDSLPNSTHPTGYERLNILDAASPTSLEDCKSLLQSLAYTNCYKDTTLPKWLSEYCGVYEGIVDLNKEQLLAENPTFDVIDSYCKAKYQKYLETGIRDNSLWQSTHQTIYDFSTGVLTIYSQEDYTKSWTATIDGLTIQHNVTISRPESDEYTCYVSLSINDESIGEVLYRDDPVNTYSTTLNPGDVITVTGAKYPKSSYANVTIPVAFDVVGGEVVTRYQGTVVVKVTSDVTISVIYI